jgi:predicted transcriptional regulator
MIQASLNFDLPRSRRSDPQSSRRAEDQMRRSGALKGQRLIALELVKANPGLSSKELATKGTLDRYQIARRLPELASMGLLRTTQTGDEDLRWWLA